MAIDFSQYARNYANPAMGQQLGQGISQSFGRIPTTEEKINMASGDVLSETFEPVIGMLQSDPSNWDLSGALGIADPGTAYQSYASGLSKRQSRFAKRKGLLNPTTFINDYNAHLKAYLPSIEAKLQHFKLQNGFSTEDMKRYVATKPGLAKLLLKSENADVKDWTVKVRSIGDAAEDLKDFLNPGEFSKDMSVGAFAKKAGLGIAAPLYGGYKMKTGFRGMPGVFDEGAWRQPGWGRQGRILGSQRYVQGAAKELLKPGSRTRIALQEARSKYASMSKKHGGPGQNTKQGRQLKKNISKMQSHLKTKLQKPQNLDDVKSLWKRLSKQFGGRKGVQRALIEKVGKRRAYWMLAKLGLGTVGTVVPEGFSTVAGVAMSAWTLWSMANLLLDLGSE